MNTIAPPHPLKVREETEESLLADCLMGKILSVKRVPRSDFWIIRDQDGTLLSHEEFNNLINELIVFYQSFTPAQLEAMRSESEKRKEERKLADANMEAGKKEAKKAQQSTEKGHVYILKATNGLYKIGKSKNVHKRAFDLQTKSPVDITVRGYIEVANYHGVEKHLHQRFAHKRQIGEWFALTEDDIESILLMGDATSPSNILQ